tara:strand:+ start:226 stop:441 length:216 start_codon:yes stop_codon:yes gene_type:complete
MNSYNKVIIHDREIMSGAEKQTHRVDEAKKSAANYRSPLGKKGCKISSPLEMTRSIEEKMLFLERGFLYGI